MGPWWPFLEAFGSVTLRYVDIQAGHSRHGKHPFTNPSVINTRKIKAYAWPRRQKAAVRDASVTAAALGGKYDGGASVHAAQVQDQLGIAVALQHHGDAPVLLVEVAGSVVRDLPVLGLWAVARGGPGGDVQNAVRHIR